LVCPSTIAVWPSYERDPAPLIDKDQAMWWSDVQFLNTIDSSSMEVRLTFNLIMGHRNLFGQQIPHGSPYY
jgi:hypothetical protein